MVRGAKYIILLVLLAAGWPAPAFANDVRNLAPSSPWNVNYAQDSCRLARQFGEGDEQTYLIFDRFEPGDGFRLTVVGTPVRGARVRRAATVRFGGEPEQEVNFFRATTNDVPTLIFPTGMRVAPYTPEDTVRYEELADSEELHLFDAAPIDPERVAAIESVSIEGEGFDPIVLATGPLGDPFAAFDRCLDELLTHWGIDVESHRNLSREATPTGSPGRWLVNADYPRNLLRRGSQGLVHFRLSVDANGRPTDCNIQQSTRPAGFDAIVCRRLMERARFYPALDADGQALASYYVNTVRFEIP